MQTKISLHDPNECEFAQHVVAGLQIEIVLGAISDPFVLILDRSTPELALSWLIIKPLEAFRTHLRVCTNSIPSLRHPGRCPIPKLLPTFRTCLTQTGAKFSKSLGIWAETAPQGGPQFGVCLKGFSKHPKMPILASAFLNVADLGSK